MSNERLKQLAKSLLKGDKVAAMRMTLLSQGDRIAVGEMIMEMRQSIKSTT